MSRLLSCLMPAHAAVVAELDHLADAVSECNSKAGLTAELILGKYVIVERNGKEIPIVFSRELQHSEAISHRAGTIVSAGFYQFFAPDQVLVTGESTTLNLKSRPQDAEIIRRHILFLPVEI